MYTSRIAEFYFIFDYLLFSVSKGVQYMKSAKNVDEYIAQAPKEVQEKLKELRAVIRTTAPGAEERISYGMPYYYYKGRLVYFQLWKEHIGLYVPTPVVEEHKSELKGFETTNATVRFPLDEKLPLALIEKLVKARVRKNDEAEKKK
jgi:uncharacterized protein YdhG (YjbR/CyaY superfamily)